MIRFECDNCCARLTAPAESAATRRRCPHCYCPQMVPWEGGRALPFDAADDIEAACLKTTQWFRSRDYQVLPLVAPQKSGRFGRLIHADKRGSSIFVYIAVGRWSDGLDVERDLLEAARSLRGRRTPQFRILSAHRVPDRLSFLFGSSKAAQAEA